MNKAFNRAVGQNIKRLREKNNWKQSDLEAKLGLCKSPITRSTIAKIEAGQRNIYLNELKLFKDIFKVNYEAFLKIHQKTTYLHLYRCILSIF